jgi:hypothetical protein
MLARAAERARGCAAAVSVGTASPLAPESVSEELANHVLPHLEADLRLSAAVQGTERGRLVAELSEQRQELGLLVEELDRLLLDRAARPHATGPRRRVAQTLRGVACLLDRHLATEQELWVSLDAEPDGDRRRALLAQEAELGERLAAGTLRFVWHPPVAPTEATALRRNPKASRVVILDAADASSARSDGVVGHQGRIEG